MLKILGNFLCFLFFAGSLFASDSSWIRINQLGYLPKGTKVAVWCSKDLKTPKQFLIIDAISKKVVFTGYASKEFGQLEQANIDWLFGCNPWGTSMVYGLPRNGDTPVDPHSAFTHLKNYPINGGLVDGPVYTSIYKNLIGIQLKDADEYAPFQSDLAVYHDDYGDYSTNEPTMDGTASLIYLLAAQEAFAGKSPIKNNTIAAQHTMQKGAIVKASVTDQSVALVFTGDEFGDGLSIIQQKLKEEKVAASFFFTGRFYRNSNFKFGIKKLIQSNHYMGPHSDAHLLYNDWTKRDSLLISYQQFTDDLNKNLDAMEVLGINTKQVNYFNSYWNRS